MAEYVVVVDDLDHEVGREEKLTAHRTPRLHRAVSVFVFDRAGRMLLQRRAGAKYHSGGLWSNTCCGHPRPGEPPVEAARRRLEEEMGFGCALTRACTVRYQLDVGCGLTEHEYDHVFVGAFDGQPAPDPGEVHDWRWVDRPTLRRLLRNRPSEFTPWFALILAPLEASLRNGSRGAVVW